MKQNTFSHRQTRTYMEKAKKKSEDMGASSHWGLFSFGARICCERKRLMTSQHHIINWIRPIFSFLQTYLSRAIGLKSYKVSIFSLRNWKSLTTVCLSWSASFPSDKSLMNSAQWFFSSLNIFMCFLNQSNVHLYPEAVACCSSYLFPNHFLLRNISFSAPLTLRKTEPLAFRDCLPLV